MGAHRLAATATAAMLVPLLLLAAQPAAAGASQQWTGDVPDGMEYDPALGQLRSDILERDAAVAAGSGADYEVTLGRLRVQRQMDSAVETLSLTYPDSFGGVYWDEGLALVAQFKGEVPYAAVRLLASVGVTVKEASVRYSAEELRQLSDDVRDSLEVLGLPDSVVGIDPRNQRVIVTVGASPLVEPELAQAIQRMTDAPVSVEVAEGPTSIPLTVHGGADLWQDALHFRCTTGFTVFSGSTTGTATAGHCHPLLPAGSYYRDPYAHVNHNLTYQNSVLGNWGDFGWWTTTGEEWDDFYHGNFNVIRDVSGVKNTFSYGDPLNFYGRGSKVEYSSTVGWIGISDGTTSNLVCLYSTSGAEGDSGGPVYSGSIAAGYVTEHLLISGANRLCFSQARYIDDALGVSVKF